jgi:hypothetical protein
MVRDVIQISSNRRFDFPKRGQLFIRTHNESLSVVAMRIGNEDYSPARIHPCDAAQTARESCSIGSRQNCFLIAKSQMMLLGWPALETKRSWRFTDDRFKFLGFQHRTEDDQI